MTIFGITISKKIIPLIIIIMTFVIDNILQIIIKKVFNPNINRKKIDKKKIKTLRTVFCSISKYVVWIIGLFVLLSYFGINTTAIVTGLGVISLVIGLAFQDMLKDILVGFSILFENQFSVGDLVKINDFTGTVIYLGIKSTKLQAYTGEVKIISNRNISEVINYSVDNTLAIVDVPISYETKIDKAEKVLLLHAMTLKDKIPEIVDDIIYMGVQELADSSVILRFSAKCKPAEHFAAERVLKKEFKNCLDKNGIKIPYPQLEVHNEK